MVLGQEDHVGDEWAKEKEKEEAAAAEEVVGEVERPPVVVCHLTKEYLSPSLSLIETALSTRWNFSLKEWVVTLPHCIG